MNQQKREREKEREKKRLYIIIINQRLLLNEKLDLLNERYVGNRYISNICFY